LAVTAAVAAAARYLLLPQPAAARGASSKKVDPQLLAAFQEALSAKSYEVNSITHVDCAFGLPYFAMQFCRRGPAAKQ
jgi:hypothetical protein